jgi:hypothetical protein
MEDQQDFIEFHFIKNSDFRTTLADGIIGSLTPTGYINMNFYTDRFPIPDTIRREVKNGEVGQEIGRISSRKGIIREVSVGVIFDIATAKGIIDSLNDLVKKLGEVEQQNNDE